MGLAVAHRETNAPDGVLVQEAAAGSGESYGALYDRYAEQVYNYCLRVTGSPEDAADATQEAFVNVLRRLHENDRPVLEFSSYLFAAARNESYALMRRRARVQPSDRPPEDRGRAADVATQPEPAVLMRDSQAAVREANAKLAPRHREVLALRELGGQSYDEIGRVMGLSENGAAQLIFRARTKLREAITAGAVASVVATSTDCERAQQLLSRIQDDEPVDELDRFWLDQHLEECGSCRSARGMLLEVGAFYCAWVPVAAAAAMKTETLTAAGSLIGADWSGVAAGGSGGGAGAGGAGAGAGGAGGGAGVAAAGVATLAAIGLALAAILPGGSDELVDKRITPPAEQPAESKAKPEPKSSTAARAEPDGAIAPAVATSPLAADRMLDALDHGVAGRRELPAENPRPNPPDRDATEPRDSNPAPEPRSDGPGPGPGGPGPPASPGPRDDPPVDRTPGDPGPPGPNPPKPDPRDPPVDTKPPDPPPPPDPPATENCTWPGGGNGQGPGGCPPGHGGIPPGHGGTPPGQVKQ